MGDERGESEMDGIKNTVQLYATVKETPLRSGTQKGTMNSYDTRAQGGRQGPECFLVESTPNSHLMNKGN